MMAIHVVACIVSDQALKMNTFGVSYLACSMNDLQLEALFLVVVVKL
jgi:hypothetical protein